MREAQNLEDRIYLQIIEEMTFQLLAAEQMDSLDEALTLVRNLEVVQYFDSIQNFAVSSDRMFFRNKIITAIARKVDKNTLENFLETIISISKVPAKNSPNDGLFFSGVYLLVSRKILSENSLPKSTKLALEIVKYTHSDADSTQLLSALAPCLSDGLFPNALRLIAETFALDHYRCEVLCNLAPYLPIDQLSEALALVCHAIKTQQYKATTLIHLIPRLSIDELASVLDLLGVNHHIAVEVPGASGDGTVAGMITQPTLQAKLMGGISQAFSCPVNID